MRLKVNRNDFIVLTKIGNDYVPEQKGKTLKIYLQKDDICNWIDFGDKRLMIHRIGSDYCFDLYVKETNEEILKLIGE